MLRAHEYAEDMYAAIDLAVDKLDRQVRRYRERRRHWRPHHQARDIEALLPLSDDDEAASAAAEANGAEPELPIPTIVKTKRFNMKPMDPDEAALQLELVGHEFYVFLNAESDAVAVIYRRRDGNLGRDRARSGLTAGGARAGRVAQVPPATFHAGAPRAPAACLRRRFTFP